MADGWYRDAPRGAWRKNLIVSSAWGLMAALLKNEPGVRGILYCAIGEGDRAWDAGSPPLPTPATTRLRKEIARVAVAAADIDYLDATGRPTTTPTHRLALTVHVGAAVAARQLREFGLFGGEATLAAGSGRLLNYAIHPVIELRGGQTLTRTIRLSIRPATGAGAVPDAADVPSHWLAAQPVTVIDGVGASVAESLTASKVATVGDLAQVDPAKPPAGLAGSRAVELKAKARLALQTAAQLGRLPAVDEETVDHVLTGPVDPSVPADALESLRAQLGLLQVALDARMLRKMTLRELRSGPQ